MKICRRTRQAARKGWGQVRPQSIDTTDTVTSKRERGHTHGVPALVLQLVGALQNALEPGATRERGYGRPRQVSTVATWLRHVPPPQQATTAGTTRARPHAHPADTTTAAPRTLQRAEGLTRWHTRVTHHAHTHVVSISRLCGCSMYSGMSRNASSRIWNPACLNRWHSSVLPHPGGGRGDAWRGVGRRGGGGSGERVSERRVHTGGGAPITRANHPVPATRMPPAAAAGSDKASCPQRLCVTGSTRNSDKQGGRGAGASSAWGVNWRDGGAYVPWQPSRQITIMVTTGGHESCGTGAIRRRTGCTEHSHGRLGQRSTWTAGDRGCSVGGSARTRRLVPASNLTVPRISKPGN